MTLLVTPYAEGCVFCGTKEGMGEEALMCSVCIDKFLASRTEEELAAMEKEATELFKDGELAQAMELISRARSQENKN